MDFPRKISTKTTKGGQILVNDKSQALARFEQSNWLDCRISAYTELDDSPNFLFIDIDTLDRPVLTKVLDRCAKFGIFSNGPIHGQRLSYLSACGRAKIQLQRIENFAKYSLTNEELITQFLRVSADYISERRKDPNHNPSLKSCMVRVPGSINSKNGQEVTIMQEWDGNRPDITSLLGIFYSRLATRKIIAEKSQRPISKFRADNSSNKINWIEILLKTPLDDYRKTIVNLILAPYLVNIRRPANKKAFEIIKEWLELCSARRKLDFNVNSLISNALHNALKSCYKPMRLDTLKARNPEIYKRLA